MINQMKRFIRTLGFISVFIFLFFPISIIRGEVNDMGGGPSKSETLKIGLTQDPSAAQILREAVGEPAADLNDHLAKAFDVRGDAKILKKGSEDWQSMRKDMVIEAGDQILTGDDSYVDIAYDSKFLNVARIKEKTKAEFRSIEPTELLLEDGTIFNALDGLNGNTYQISTPTAVAGVRGTTFTASYDAQLGKNFFDVYPDKSLHEGVIEIIPGDEREPVLLKEGETLNPEGSVEAIPEDRMEEGKVLLSAVLEERQEFVDQEGVSTAVTEKTEAQETNDSATDNEKKTDGPNDDGTGGGDAGSNGANNDNSSGDLLADTLIPQDSEIGSSGSAEDLSDVVKFFATGGNDEFSEHAAEGSEAGSSADYGAMLESMGVDSEFAESMEKFMGETGGAEDTADLLINEDTAGTDFSSGGEEAVYDFGSGEDTAGPNPNEYQDAGSFVPDPTTLVDEAVKEETQEQTSGNSGGSGSSGSGGTGTTKTI